MNKKKQQPPFGLDDLDVDFDILPQLVGHHIGRAYRALYNHFSKATAAFDITPRQFIALTLVEANPDQTQTVIAKAAGIERSTMVTLVDTLQERGLLVRNPSKNDRRSYALALTDKGIKLVNDVKPLVLNHDRDITRHLDSAEMAAMVTNLDKILLGER